MKKLAFSIPFTGFSDLDFISVLSSVTLYLEGITGSDEYGCPKETTDDCTGCGSCRSSLHNIHEQTYFLLDTMCGRSSLRCRFDGAQTEIQKWIDKKDGLKRIEKIMEYNDTAGLWDEYQQKMDWYGGMDIIAPEERTVRMKRTADTMWHTFSCHNFAEVFRNRSTDGLKEPVFDEMQRIINPSNGYTHGP